jgi:catechol 2,3-dioxygenase-like lactoylglutathione lyase family enzyme
MSMMHAASPRGIDHLVLPARDLAAQAAFYERLGFRVGSRNRHPWGTENHIVQLRGSFLELISVGEGASIAPHGPRHFSFGAHVQAALDRQGLAMLVLRSDDAQADAAEFAAAGIGNFEPFFFEREGRRADGSTVKVAFTLAFAASPAMPEAGLFVCQQHFPENFWNPAAQQHPNTALSIASVVLVADEPLDHVAFLTTFSGQNEPRKTTLGVEIDTGAGLIEVLTPAAFRFRYGDDTQRLDGSPRFAGYSIAVASTAALLGELERHAVPHLQRGNGVLVRAADAFGATLLFDTPERVGGDA